MAVQGNVSNGKECLRMCETLDLVDTHMLHQITANPSITQKELAKVVGLSPRQVARRKSSPAFLRAIEDLKFTDQELIMQVKRLALLEIKELLQNGNEKTRMKVALAVLEGDFLKVNSQQEVTSITFESFFDENGILQQQTTQMV